MLNLTITSFSHAEISGPSSLIGPKQDWLVLKPKHGLRSKLVEIKHVYIVPIVNYLFRPQHQKRRPLHSTFTGFLSPIPDKTRARKPAKNCPSLPPFAVSGKEVTVQMITTSSRSERRSRRPRLARHLNDQNLASH